MHVLVGGAQGKKTKRTVPTYGSVLFSPIASLKQRIEKMLGLGFRAIKLGWDPVCQQSLREDEKLDVISISLRIKIIGYFDTKEIDAFSCWGA